MSSTANAGFSLSDRPFSSVSNSAPLASSPGRSGRPLTLALHSVAPSGSRDREERALVVPHRIPSANERLAFFFDERVVPRFLDRCGQDRLRRVARHLQRQRAGRGTGLGAIGERQHRRRFAAAHRRAELGRIGRVEPARIASRDLAGAQHFDRHAAGLAFGGREADQRHRHHAVAGRAQLAGDGEDRIGLDRLRESSRAAVRRASCPSRPPAGPAT